MPKQTFVWDSSRREFIKRTSLAAAAAMTAPFVFSGCKTGRHFGPNDEIRVAVVGAGGKGSSDTDETAKAGGRIVALCDVDENTLNSRKQKYPDVQTFKDYRVMYDKIGKDIDAVIVATPDHHHAPASVRAMKMGKHCFCQKPLTQSVYEARLMRRLAKEKKLATQMGNQGSAGSGLRRAVEVIQAGIIGNPRELHVWSNRPIWPQGIDRPMGEDPVPASLDWDGWLGPAPVRPFKKDTYHTFKWRGWKDFGTGALGDMACHTVNMPFRALKLGYPNVVECEAISDNHDETFPKSSRIRFEFPSREGLPPLKFWWYDGNPGNKEQKPYRPSNELAAGIIEMRGDLPASGALIIGDKGQVFSPDDYGSQFFLKLGEQGFKAASNKVQGKETEHEALRGIAQTIPRSPGHYVEWIKMMQGGAPAYSNFDIAAYLTEIILLGCVALRVGTGKRLDWDGPNMKATNEPSAARFVKRDYRKGWEV